MPNNIKRTLSLKNLLLKNSFFLFGPRATGKSTLIRSELGLDAIVIDLLKNATYQRLAQNPSALEEWIGGHTGQFKWIVIDEVQKIPPLLDEVHRLIEERDYRFLLSGSSARRLKKNGVNLLAGRAWRAELFPLTSRELHTNWDLERYLRFGGLPRVVASQEPIEELDAYVDTYLKEEILQEGIVRKLDRFSGFLQMAALSCGQLINYEKISGEIGVSAPTIRQYYEVLKDTLLAFELEPYRKAKKRKPIATSKIYLFDTGVTNHLAGITHIDRNSDLYGMRFEQWLAMEIRACLSYRRIKEKLSFWRTAEKDEVDFVIGDRLAVEVKATRRVSDRDLTGLKRIRDECGIEGLYLVSQDPIAQEKSGILCLHYSDFLNRLWDKDL